MNKRFFFTALILTGLLMACEKEKLLTGTFKARYVAGMCGQNIIEILDSAYIDRGMDWTNTAGQSMKNVFTVQNHCDFSRANLKAGDIFECAIIASPDKTGCVVCMAYMETPPKAWNVKVMK
ncbi:MAG: hypothetical protein K2Q24_09495 [Chitinophagaceae bacterium]|nr:hypothetical protein [Chitinophagaceae bacterium]